MTPDNVQSLYAQKLREGLSARRIAAIHGLLHKALKNAVRTNIVGRNVCDLVTPPRPKRHEIQPLTIVQAQELLKATRGHHLETLLTMAIGTGMRRGESLALRWEDIDIETGSLSIRRSVNYVAGYGLVESEPKTPESRRKIVLPPHIIAALKKHQVYQHALQTIAGESWKEKDLVFSKTRI